MKRLFIALDPSQEVREEIARWLGPLKERARRDFPRLKIGWIDAPKLHLTLKFLGATEEARVEPVLAALREVAASQSAFELAVRGAGSFPPGPRARVLWLGIKDPARRLAPLAHEIEEAMEKLGFAREGREYSAHLTIGRFKEGRGASELLRIQAPEELVFGPAFPVRELVLYESRTLPTGPVYTVLGAAPLVTFP